MKIKISNEQIEFLKNNVKGTSDKDLLKKFNERFNVNFNINQIMHYKRVLGLKNGNDTKFKKGLEPHNKKSIGCEFIDKATGYTYIKIAEPRTWIQKQRYIYEKYYGAIPEDYSIIFLDGDKTNFSKDNLKAIKRRDKLVMKNLKLFTNNSLLTENGLLTAQIINRLHDLRRIYG